MTKQDIIEHLTHNCGLHRSSAIQAVNGVIDVITKSLIAGENVSIRGFGTLRTVDVAERKSRSILTGGPISIPAHRAARLTISKELKSRLNNDTVD